jgi:hypothetical protein
MYYVYYKSEIILHKLIFRSCFVENALVECPPLNEHLVVPGVNNVAK